MAPAFVLVPVSPILCSCLCGCLHFCAFHCYYPFPSHASAFCSFSVLVRSFALFLAKPFLAESSPLSSPESSLLSNSGFSHLSNPQSSLVSRLLSSLLCLVTCLTMPRSETPISGDTRRTHEWRQGCRAGGQVRVKCHELQPPMPRIFLANVQSARRKRKISIPKRAEELLCPEQESTQSNQRDLQFIRLIGQRRWSSADHSIWPESSTRCF